MADWKVHFNRPVRLPEHGQLLCDSLEGGHLSGNGPFTKCCEAELERRLGKPTRLVTSATHALELMAWLGEIGPGDEVIVPSFTFVSTANAFALRGARVRFADNDEYGNLLPSEVERLATPRTKAVVAMHYAGGSADLDRLLEACAGARGASGRGIPLFEDAAQTIGATYKGRPLGTLGALGCLSFHETKNVTSGEGGAVIFGDDRSLERMEIMREKGTDRSRFFKGLVDKYTWVDVGSNFLLSDLNAAYLAPQLKRLDEINARRAQLWKRYESELAASLSRVDARILEAPPYNTTNHHMFAAIFPTLAARDKFIAAMRADSILCVFHYVPLHTSPRGAAFYDGAPERLPGCEKISSCLVRFPLYYNMTEDEQGYVIDRMKKHLKG